MYVYIRNRKKRSKIYIKKKTSLIHRNIITINCIRNLLNVSFAKYQKLSLAKLNNLYAYSKHYAKVFSNF